MGQLTRRAVAGNGLNVLNMGLDIGVRMQHTTMASASRLKGLTCERCGCQYAYVLTRAATGQATHQPALSVLGDEGDRAYDAARRNALGAVRRKLTWDVDLIPCPECETVQHDMLVVARRQMWPQRLWPAGLGALAILSGVLVLLFRAPRAGSQEATFPGHALSIVLVAIGAALVLYGLFRYWSFDINDEPELRRDCLRAARARGLWTRQELEDLAEEDPETDISGALLDWERQKLP